MGTTSEVTELPKCAFCDESAKYDAVTNFLGERGPWAYMCEQHFLSHSCLRLGTGWGQMLVTASNT